MEADNPTADAIEWPLMEYCTTGLSKKYHADQLNTFKKKVKINHGIIGCPRFHKRFKLLRGVVSLKTMKHN